MDWVCDHRLLGGRKEFIKFFKRPIEDGQDRNADTETRLFGEEMAKKLNTMIFSVSLRREKSVVLKETTMPTIMSKRKGTKRSPKRISKKGISLTKLRSQLEELSDSALYDNGNKLNVVIPLIVNLIDEGHRVLVFGRYLKMLCIIAECLRRRCVDCLHYNGKLNTQQREETLNRFHASEANVLLITVGAGGEGITITEADRIILIDPNWNPTVDDQAIDRAYVLLPSYVVDIELGRTRTCWCID